MRKLVFRTAATNELRRIARFTNAEWSVEQARKYSEELRDRIKSLAEYPLRYPEFEARPGLRQMRCGQHMVFYRVTDEVIEIVQIIHVAREFETWLK